MLTILTYALFTGLSVFAQTWWHLLICRFLAALGIGGEWAVGAALLSETWPHRWRPWIAAVLQSAVNCGILLAMVAGLAMKDLPCRCVFLVGILPALIVVWIRRTVPETAEWHAAKLKANKVEPKILDLFRGPTRRITVLTILVCSFSLTAHWAFMFWWIQHLRNLPDLAGWSDPQKTALASAAMIWLMATSIAGNFVAAAIARVIGYRRTIAWMCVGYFGSLFLTYNVVRTHESMFLWLAAMGVSSGLFALFTMYLPPLFPTLLRTTGAGFCYNIGRIVAAAGTVFFGTLPRRKRLPHGVALHGLPLPPRRRRGNFFTRTAEWRYNIGKETSPQRPQSQIAFWFSEKRRRPFGLLQLNTWMLPPSLKPIKS